MTHRRLRPASEAVNNLVAGLRPANTLDEIQVIWAAAAGEGIAAEATPTGEVGGVLTVTCTSAVWAHELDLLAPGIIDRVNAALGDERITSLRCQSVPSRGWSRRSR
ncbi:unannotated protein [freshwater metagenome]|uniref:Unannotated protein n=1 Tax=freshwater metagenome TaxID=449393 RepID=A0A6J7HD20_9ZZZZ|nr:DUF721 domain-containing protein [Actinomycetota bacterium]